MVIIKVEAVGSRPPKSPSCLALIPLVSSCGGAVMFSRALAGVSTPLPDTKAVFWCRAGFLCGVLVFSCALLPCLSLSSPSPPSGFSCSIIICCGKLRRYFRRLASFGARQWRWLVLGLSGGSVGFCLVALLTLMFSIHWHPTVEYMVKWW